MKLSDLQAVNNLDRQLDAVLDNIKKLADVETVSIKFAGSELVEFHGIRAKGPEVPTGSLLEAHDLFRDVLSTVGFQLARQKLDLSRKLRDLGVEGLP